MWIPYQVQNDEQGSFWIATLYAPRNDTLPTDAVTLCHNYSLAFKITRG